VRLYVQEAGKRRAFRMSEGVLTIGSSEEANLTLASKDVAAIHFELHRRGGRAKLVPRPGVQPPTVGGVPALGEVALLPRQVVVVGETKLWLEDEMPSRPAPGRGPGPGTPPAAVKESTATYPRTSSGTSPGTSSGRTPAGAGRSRVSARRRGSERKHGLPSGAIFAFVVLVLALLFPFASRFLELTQEQSEESIQARLAAARRDVEEGSFGAAEKRLAALEVGREPSVEEARVIEELRREIARAKEDAAVAQHNLAGYRYKNVLVEYEEKYLQGAPDPPKARHFLELAREFREQWPEHPELAWVERQVSRFEGGVDLRTPPTRADVEWIVLYTTGGEPRDYWYAARAVEGLRDRTSGEEREWAEERLAEMEEERLAHHRDRMEEAERLFQEGDEGRAVWWLVHQVIGSGDQATADEAARVLVRMPSARSQLRGYERNHPNKFATLLENDVVRSFWESGG